MTPESPPLPFTTAELAAIRGLWPLDPGRAFTNHGSYGAVPQPVLDAVAALAARIAHNPNAFFLKDRADLIDAARAAVGGFLHADPAGLAFVPIVTTAVSVLLGSLRLTAGDEVVTTSHAYGAVSMAMQRYAVDAGARVRVAELTLTPDTGEILAAIDEKLTARTRLVLIDQITSMTARLFDVAAIARPLAERGVVVAVDAAHTPGVLDLDVDALADDGVAVWIGNLHKWVCAPPGGAVLYAAPAARAWLRPLVVSWREEEGYPTAVTYQGTSNVTSWLAAPAAIALHEELGWEPVRAHGIRLAKEGGQIVADALGTKPIPGDPVPMCLVPFECEERFAAMAAIREAHPVELAITEYAGDHFVRVSAHLYNTREGYVALARACAAHVTHN